MQRGVASQAHSTSAHGETTQARSDRVVQRQLGQVSSVPAGPRPPRATATVNVSMDMRRVGGHNRRGVRNEGRMVCP